MPKERGGGGAALAGAPWRNEAGRGGKQSPARWQSGKPNALKVGLEEWGRKAMMSQGLAGWGWVEIQVWRTTCCLPELCYRKARCQRLNPPMKEARTRQDGREERTEAGVMQTEGKTAGRRREGGRKEKEQVKQDKSRAKSAVLTLPGTVTVSCELAVS